MRFEVRAAIHNICAQRIYHASLPQNVTSYEDGLIRYLGLLVSHL